MELENGVRVGFSGLTATDTVLTVGADGVLTLSRSDYLRVVASGFLPESRFGVVMFSDPVKVADGTAGTEGDIDAKFRIPEVLEPGRHTLQVNGVDSSNRVVSVSAPVDVAGESTSPLGRAVLIVIVLALIIAVVLPAGLRRRRTS